MFDIFQNTTRPNFELFFKKNDPEDIRLGEIVSLLPEDYDASDIIILSCPQDQGVARNNGRIGAASAPDAVRTQFYKLTNFGITIKIFDLGDTFVDKSLEEIHDSHTLIVEQILRDGKNLIVLGGGNDVSYADGAAMAKVFGKNRWQAVNIDAHFDVRSNKIRNSGTPYRQLLDEKLLIAENFTEIGFQPQANSPIHFGYLKNLGVEMISLEEFQKIQSMDDKLALKFADNLPVFWGFDVDSVRSSDAPGVSASSPTGLTADQFIHLAAIAGNLDQSKIVEFTEVNPKFDVDNRTAKLTAIAMHKYCSK